MGYVKIQNFKRSCFQDLTISFAFGVKLYLKNGLYKSLENATLHIGYQYYITHWIAQNTVKSLQLKDP